MNRRCLPKPPGVVVGSTPLSWGERLASSTVGLCSAYCSRVFSIHRSGFTSACCSGTPVACSAGISIACCSGNPFAYCSGTSSLPLDCSSTRVLCEGICTLGGGATGSSSSSDHSITVAFHVRVVWSPPSEMLPGLWGAAVAVLLFFWAGSSAAVRFPRDFSYTGGDSPCDQHPCLWTPMRYRWNFL